MAKLGSITVKFENTIMEICDSHPTCEGCIFREEYKGCYFRGKTPKEWHEIRRVTANCTEGMKEILITTENHERDKDD